VNNYLDHDPLPPLVTPSKWLLAVLATLVYLALWQDAERGPDSSIIKLLWTSVSSGIRKAEREKKI
jgi:hypothetical protein